MADKKLTYEQMEFIFQGAMEAARKTLFDDNFEQHGWTFKDFSIAAAEYQNAIIEGKIQRWVN
jgi:hypothetical protein